MDWRALWHRLDGGLDAVIWLHERTMLYICLVVLVPLMALVTGSLLVADLRVAIAPWVDVTIPYLTAGLPVWLVGTALVERSSHPLAARYRELLPQAPVAIGIALFAVGGLIWWQGVP